MPLRAESLAYSLRTSSDFRCNWWYMSIHLKF
ncbi:hypothetical protein KEK_05532 [Mycolicibacterium thermoresistibile ATCC 19527]|uniref:Uncharacterized protein n=1 Tax=Mycolicibacterium thermoresistibile (strain ATCC 19527 / DSM 44167 / CIP 105390 / JCM 6362 / NCTC 10409 / 316) TaxID=1078020 RepID=G7CDQ4_MYCT3|nr:hypothetical protein KEK_05532 [Mycolicibacterium thermoresistibile ATCC 19527]